MKPKNRQSVYLRLVVILSFIFSFLFLSSLLNIIALHISAVLAVGILIFCILYGRKKHNIKKLLSYLLISVAILSAALIYDSSLLYRKYIFRNWEQITKSSLESETEKIQRSFIELQWEIASRSEKLVEDYRQFIEEKDILSDDPKQKLAEFLDGYENLFEQGNYLYGISIFDSSGVLLAWCGENPIEFLPLIYNYETRDSFFYITSDEVKTYLNHINIIDRKSNVEPTFIVVRRLLRSNFKIHNRFFKDYNYFEDIASFNHEISFINVEDTEGQRQWEKLFYRNRDNYWGRSGDATKTLTVPLRNLSFEILGYSSVTTPTLGEQIHKVKNRYVFIADTILLLTLFLLLVVWLRRYVKEQKRMEEETGADLWSWWRCALKTLGLLWAFRFSFLLLGYPTRFTDIDIFRPSYFALDIVHINSPIDEIFNLFASPFDLFFTLVVLLLTLIILSNMVFRDIRLKLKDKRIESKSNPKKSVNRRDRIIKTVLAVVISVAAWFVMVLGFKICHDFVREIFENSRVNILGSIFIDTNLPSFLIQVSAIIIAIAFFFLVLLFNYLLFIFLTKFQKTTGSLIITIGVDLLAVLGVFIILSPAGLNIFQLFIVFLPPGAVFYITVKTVFREKTRKAVFRFFALIATLFLSVAVLSPMFFITFQEQQEDFIERNLVNRVEEQREWKRILIRNTLDQLSRDRVLMIKLKEGYRSNLEALAFSLWSKLDHSLKGYNTSLEIKDMGGNIIDRFSINPIFNNRDLTPSEDSKSVYLTGKSILYNNNNIEIIVGQAIIKDGDEKIARILLCYALDYTYIFLPSSRNPYYELFRTSAESFTEDSVFSSNLFFLIYDSDGNYKSGSDEFVIPLESQNLEILRHLDEPRWLEIQVGQKFYKMYAFKYGEDIFLLGFPEFVLLDTLFYLSEALGVCFMGAVLFLFIIHLLRIRGRLGGFNRFSDFLSIFRSSYIRLVIIFIIISILPIVYLSFFTRAHLSGKLSGEVEKRGLNSLTVVKRYLDFNVLRARIRDEETLLNIITDPLISDIGRWVNKDLNVYSGRELIATNKQELYFSRLLPTIINDQLYEGLVLKKEIYTTARERIGDLDYLVVSTRVPTDNPDMPLIITIPLMTEQNRIKQELLAFDRLILLVVIGLVLVFVLLSHGLAKYFADPLHRLTRGAEQIASGDYNVQVDVKRKDELGYLIRSFNKMSRRLEEHRSELYKKTKDLESILTHASPAVISINTEDKILIINPAALQMLRLKGNIGDYQNSDLGKALKKNEALQSLYDAFEHYKSKPLSIIRSDLRISFSEDERELVANLIITPMRDKNGNRYASLIIIEDVTEIVRSKRLEAWAEMARIIAHEIKNPLTPIQLATEHMQQVIKDKPKDFEKISNECLDTILNQVEVLQQISNDFSQYSKLPQLRTKPIDLAKFLKEVVSPYSVATPEGVEMKLELPSKAPYVLIDEKLFKQTLFNLFENSFFAMQGGGELKIKVDYGKEMKKKGLVAIYVIDNGTGINPKILPRIFEPYFTTKDGGVGLGLAIAKKTIEEHQGSIELETKYGKGTTIKITLKEYRGKEHPHKKGKN